MNLTEQKNPSGTLRISRDVIASVAAAAAKEVGGVYAIAKPAMNLRGIVDRSEKDVVFNDGIAQVRMRLVVEEGARIRQTAESVQEAVKEAVQNMTGITVSKVNVVIAGVHYAAAAD